jgi:hypothetical protein
VQKAGLISYNRGHIRMLDRAGLEARACECYAVVKKEFDRLLPETPSKPSLPTTAISADAPSSMT